jgi:repressor of nif and glnA expression
MTVVCVGDTISVTVNGVLVNEGKNASVTAGAIGFQSEGSPIEFRNIVLYQK